MSKLTIETVFLKDLVTMSLIAITNLPKDKLFFHLQSIDNRIQKGTLLESELSFQLLNAYQYYILYMPIIDNDYYQKTRL